MENFNKLIAYLMAVRSYAKDIHYSCHGDAFYGKHLFADLVQDGLYDYIDQIKEICLLGNELNPLPSSDYERMAADLTPPVAQNDDQLNFQKLKEFLTEVLEFTENMNDLTKGEENLIGAISQDLQQMLGLVNRQVMG